MITPAMISKNHKFSENSKLTTNKEFILPSCGTGRISKAGEGCANPLIVCNSVRTTTKIAVVAGTDNIAITVGLESCRASLEQVSSISAKALLTYFNNVSPSCLIPHLKIELSSNRKLRNRVRRTYQTPCLQLSTHTRHTYSNMLWRYYWSEDSTDMETLGCPQHRQHIQCNSSFQEDR